MRYILDQNNNPVQCDDLFKWSRWMAEQKFHVVLSDGDVKVSTVFLGTDHNYTNEGPPILFETMVFGGDMDDYQVRYSTHAQACKGHLRICAMVWPGGR